MGRVSRPATVALIGPMGAGKSEVGRVVARILGRRFRDTDRMVERRTGQRIPEIFRTKGESVFRELESAAVQQALDSPGAVIACGGGVVLQAANIKALRRSGRVVYLKPSLEVALSRVGSGEGRPLLEGKDPSLELTRLFQDRDPLYSQAADHVIDADGSVQEVARAILAEIGKPIHQGSQGQSASSLPS